jgi:hypothetical protein
MTSQNNFLFCTAAVSNKPNKPQHKKYNQRSMELRIETCNAFYKSKTKQSNYYCHFSVTS